MNYLRKYDYFKQIQDVNLQQVINATDSYRIDAERAAEKRVVSYLTQKYDTSKEFTPTLPFNYTKVYRARMRAELNFDAYSAASTYALNSLVINAGNAYINTTAITVAEPFNASKWALLGAQYDLFYVPAPYPEFNYREFYSIGDKVFYKDKIYECLAESTPLGHEEMLQYPSYASLPYANVFPDAVRDGVKNWGVGQDYSFSQLSPIKTSADFTAWSSVTAYVTGNRVAYDSKIWQALASSTNVIPGEDITKWQPISFTLGDNRNEDMVMNMIDIVLFILHSRIAPRNIPELRIIRNTAAISFLKNSARGEDITLDLPVKQPIQGNRIRWGGAIKNQNNY